jgi:hypothetical protein
MIVFAALIDYYLVDNPIFCEKSEQVFVDDMIRSSGMSVANFPVTAVLVDE